ncbi:unnamed protein product, partial [Ectocarpus fasciculatus]
VLRSGAYSTTSGTVDDYYVSVPVSTSVSGCIDEYISDGWCDFENNDAECDWDGGD